MKKNKKISLTEQRVAAEILTKFMFVRNMDEHNELWQHIFDSYELCTDPFTYCPCSCLDYSKSKLEFDKQIMEDMYGHCDVLE